jgi:hypothetical protein
MCQAAGAESRSSRYAAPDGDDEGRRPGAGGRAGVSDEDRRGFDPRNLLWALVLAAACAALVRVFFFTHS